MFDSNLRVGEEFLASLRESAQEANAAMIEASQMGFELLEATVRDNARQHEAWRDVADHIEVWTEEGRIWLGVRNQAFMSEAQTAEFGDMQRPPISMIRSHADVERMAEKAISQDIDRRLGVMV